jgi:hypothetical protein
MVVCALALLISAQSIAEEPAILHIRGEFQSIQQALRSLTVQSVDLDGYSTEGGEAKAFRDKNGDIRFIKVELLFESGKSFQEYYYENGRLIFAFVQDHRYNVPFYVTPDVAKEIGAEPFDSGKTTIAENRYYFVNARLVRWVNEQNAEVPPGSREFKAAEKQVIETSDKMLAEIQTAT